MTLDLHAAQLLQKMMSDIYQMHDYTRKTLLHEATM